MLDKEVKSFFNRKFHYFNEYLSQAIKRRNASIEMGQRLMSIKASMKMHDHSFEIRQILKAAKEKFDLAEIKFKELLEGLKATDEESAKYLLNFQEESLNWHKIITKIEREATSLAQIADEVAASRFEVFDQLESYYQEKGLLK